MMTDFLLFLSELFIAKQNLEIKIMLHANVPSNHAALCGSLAESFESDRAH